VILLLDTNAFIWSLANTDKLGRRALADISNNANQVYVSSISLLECAIKIRTGKLKFSLDFSQVDGVLEEADIQQVAFDVWAAPELSWSDPFDAAIIAQATAKHMTLVTSDSNILESTIVGLHTLDAEK
jgi:PIN domain nuclease of toxin-antitoxin system